MKVVPWFSIDGYRVVTERGRGGDCHVSATVTAYIGPECTEREASGVGPVHALDRALRACLRDAWPGLDAVRLADYDVSVVDAARGTASPVRVVITFADAAGRWDAGYVSDNIIDASMEALCAATIIGIMRLPSDVGEVVVG
ncbi:MAG TPA: alpha-isopropylmalate synthase regulatory domain-containing protein [Actinomycetota bacterium]|nr:alpha-isopropylmalate synthase regulatory domain-containing protein [Actinomycetota bacterium]